MQEQEKDYTQYNAEKVLEKLERMNPYGSIQIRPFCDQLSIFDWWVDTLSRTKRNQMRTFLKNAIRLGFKGYVCFNVGDVGCSNGMWAYKSTTTDGYSPDGDFIYRSFAPDHTYYDAEINGETITESKGLEWNDIKTIKQLEKLIANN